MATGPGCIVSASMWSYNLPCTTTWQPFEPRPTGDIGDLECPLTQMGPNKDDDPACWGVFSNQPTDCPEYWTSAGETTYEPEEGVTFITSFCCPEVYPYTLHSSPRVTVTTIDDTEYSVAVDPSWLRWSSWCGATSVEALSDQTITMHAPSPSVTEVAWDFENDILVAPAAPVTKYIYSWEEKHWTCSGLCSPIYTNPLKPRTSSSSPEPTPAPTGTYVPPPSHAVTQFTPGESCMADSMKWLVSTACNLGSDLPEWAECAVTMTGNPHAGTRCNQMPHYTIGSDDEYTYYNKCPVGYKVARSTEYWPFYSVYTNEQDGTKSYSTTTYDAVDRIFACCPEGADFSEITDGSYITTATHTNGDRANVELYVPPRCVATRVEDLADQDVALTMYYNRMIPDKKRKRQDNTEQDEESDGESESEEEEGYPIVGTTTRKWNVDNDILFAEPASFGYTVFHGTYTCFESCREYFTYSYNNTDPNYTPTPSSEITGTGGSGGGGGDGGSITPTGEPQPSETRGAASTLNKRSALLVAMYVAVGLWLV